MSSSSAVVASTIGRATASFWAALGSSSFVLLMHWIARIDQDHNFRGARHQFLEDFYLFATKFPGM